MANKRTLSDNKQTACNKLVSCMTCKHALLHRYGNNPVLAACTMQPQQFSTRFPYQVEVASTMRRCSNYKEAAAPKTVEQRSKVA